MLGKYVADILSAKDFSTALNGFAPAYQMYDPGSQQAVMNFFADVHAQFIGSETDPEAATSALAGNKVVRLADGGFIDNTAVAQTLRYLQNRSDDKLVPDSFDIIALDNMPAPQPADAFATGGDIAALFGFDGCGKSGCMMQQDGVHNGKLIVLNFATQSAQVFRCDGYFETAGGNCDPNKPLDNTYWAPSTEDEKILCSIKGKDVEQRLTYSRYTVTVDPSLPGSMLYGLKTASGGATGTLHVFSYLGADAAVVPGNDEQYACYDKSVKGIVSNVMAKGGAACDVSKPASSSTNPCSLGDYLENVLGL